MSALLHGCCNIWLLCADALLYEVSRATEDGSGECVGSFTVNKLLPFDPRLELLPLANCDCCWACTAAANC